MFLAGLTAHANAGSTQAIVVELYTSQGCSSCPPADKYLTELAARDDVIALGLHVDYWDYIGWKDVFGAPAYAERQRAYAHVAGRRSVYTPQMIIQGNEHVVGNHAQDVNKLIRRYQTAKPPVTLAAQRDGRKLLVTAQAQEGVKTGEATVLLVRYVPSETTRIKRGENTGKSIAYANIVHELKVVGKWNMHKPLSLSVRSAPDMKSAVIIQRAGFGPILAGVRVD
ncbi:DUF1223 domain-containing protein [Lentibacter algarum]|nr:DUF1223 domain-containing protein [Lentibacter algarum]